MSTDSSPPSPVFVTTRWTQVLRSRGDSPESRAALADLCAAYWTPVFRFLRRERDEETARDLAQEFFARLLARGGVDGADPGRGRFRSFLLGAVKHFLADVRDHERRQKRGGGIVPESLDAPAPGCDPDHASPMGSQIADPSSPAPDAFFDRQWALALMDRALGMVEREYAADGRAEHFRVLKPWLVGDARPLSQADGSRALGLSEGAVKVAIHRLRKRFRETIRSEIAQTVEDPARVEEELRYLVQVLAEG